MNMFDPIMDEVESQQKAANKMKNLLFVALILLSAALTAAGLYFLSFINTLFAAVKEFVTALSNIEVKLGKEQLSTTGEQLAGIIGNNTLWMPIIGGIVVALIVVAYMFRINVKRSIECDERKIELLMLKSVYQEVGLTQELESKMISGNSERQAFEPPSVIPTVEIAEKSLDSINKLLLNSSSIANRLKNRT
ncbi:MULTISPECIES: hypothetical protein [Vibrio]|uniref:hypothetical protein n=1 Tax=Vibrio TaxID=662 RepID=UPI0005C5D570|nr:hypothetical protein [Vibrio cholerae]EKE6109364.1 hypothetical protein [Vibrio cholerae]EKF9477979.1 hypothetical protein [Vibrio cholerae]EKF9771310.1 hypothetical protein [Vibrio cholerae]ELJ8538790.1 hypothetical protein [Vibrio cholerae]ELJ8579544.1 hypothetical protein [Vibrio cholerae]